MIHITNKAQKGSSIPRRNLFKKRSGDEGDNVVKSQFNNKQNRPQYKSFIEKDGSSYDRHLNKLGKRMKENASKELEGKVD
jgi:hypothetical protein